MTIQLKRYDKDSTYSQVYQDDRKLWRWRLYYKDKEGEKDIIAASHQGWPHKTQCVYNRQYVIASSWDTEE